MGKKVTRASEEKENCVADGRDHLQSMSDIFPHEGGPGTTTTTAAAHDRVTSAQRSTHASPSG